MKSFSTKESKKGLVYSRVKNSAVGDRATNLGKPDAGRDSLTARRVTCQARTQFFQRRNGKHHCHPSPSPGSPAHPGGLRLTPRLAVGRGRGSQDAQPDLPAIPATERQGWCTWLHSLETDRLAEVADDSQGVPVGEPADRRPVHLQQHIPGAGRFARDDAAGAPAGLLAESPQVGELAALGAASNLSAHVARGPGPGHRTLLHLAEPVLLLLQRLRHPELRCTMGETPRRRRGPRAARAAGKGGPRRFGRRSPSTAHGGPGHSKPRVTPRTPLSAALPGTGRALRGPPRIRLQEREGNCPRAAPEGFRAGSQQPAGPPAPRPSGGKG